MEPKGIEFWLRWNCDFCYPSHAKSKFSLPKTPPKMIQKLFKKRLCNQTLPKILNFQPQSASGWQHEPKRLPKGFLLGGSAAAQKRQFYCPKLSWGQDGPQEPPSLDFGSSSHQFWLIFTCFRELFYRVVSFFSAPAVGRGSNRKQLTALTFRIRLPPRANLSRKDNLYQN